MSLESIKRIIPSALKHTGIDKEVLATMVLTEASKSLERIWGPEKAKYIEPLSFKAGCVLIRSHSSAASQLLRTVESQWINEINRGLGQKKVFAIKLVDRR